MLYFLQRVCNNYPPLQWEECRVEGDGFVHFLSWWNYLDYSSKTAQKIVVIIHNFFFLPIAQLKFNQRNQAQVED